MRQGWIIWKNLAGDEHSSLFGPFLCYDEQRFYNIGPRCGDNEPKYQVKKPFYI